MAKVKNTYLFNCVFKNGKTKSFKAYSRQEARDGAKFFKSCKALQLFTLDINGKFQSLTLVK